MRELVLAYGLGVISTAVFVGIGCVLELVETRKMDAFNYHISLDNERRKVRGCYYDSEREEKAWRKKKIH